MQYSVPFIQTNLGRITSWARDTNIRDETRRWCVSRPSWDRDV